MSGFNMATENAWVLLMENLLQSFREETVDAELPVERAIEYLYETLTEQRRDHSFGGGIYLSTVHGAKGMEFNHVFILDDGWPGGRSTQEAEEERRTYYVGMTRAREMLCLFERQDQKNPHTKLLTSDSVARRCVAISKTSPTGITNRRYELLGMQDIYLSFAARYRDQHKIHAHLARVQAGDAVTLKARDGKLEVLDDKGCCLAQLSKTASKLWSSRLAQIERVKVVGLIVRHKDDSEESYRTSCACDELGSPVVGDSISPGVKCFRFYCMPTLQGAFFKKIMVHHVELKRTAWTL